MFQSTLTKSYTQAHINFHYVASAILFHMVIIHKHLQGYLQEESETCVYKMSVNNNSPLIHKLYKCLYSTQVHQGRIVTRTYG